MRLFRLLAMLFVLILLTVASSQAGPGTVVVRGSFPAIWFWWNDYEVTNVAFTSSDPDFYVNGFCYGNWPPGPAPEFRQFSLHDLYYIASGKENLWIKGPVFTRVYGRFSSLSTLAAAGPPQRGRATSSREGKANSLPTAFPSSIGTITTPATWAPARTPGTCGPSATWPAPRPCAAAAWLTTISSSTTC